MVGILRQDAGLALLDPHLTRPGDVDGPVGGDVLVAVLVDDQEADVRGAGPELDVGEGAVGVPAGERVAGRPGGGLAVGEVAPRVQAPVGVVAVGALVVDDRVVPGGGRGRLGRGRGAGGAARRGARGVSGGVDHDGLVAQRGPGGDVLAEGLGDLVRGVVGGAEDLPSGVPDLRGEDDPVQLSAVDPGGEVHGPGGSGGRGRQGEGRGGGGPGEGAGGLVDDGGPGRHGDGDLAVGVGPQGVLGPVDAPVRHAGRAGREGGRLRLARVVEGDDVLLAGRGVGAGEGVDPGAVGRVSLGLDAVGQGRVGLAELGERGDLPVERGARVVGVARVGAVGADLVVVQVVGDLGGEHGLAGVLVAAGAGEALFVAVVDDRVATAEEHQLVGQLVLLQDLGVGGLRVVLLEEVPDAAHVVVAEEGDLFVGVGLVGRVLVVVTEDAHQLLRAAALGGVGAGRVLEGEVEGGVEAALGDVRGGDVRVRGVGLAEHEEVLPAVRRRVRVERRRPLRPEPHADVLDGVDPEAVDGEVLHPPLVDPLHAVHDLGTLGPQVVQSGEVAVGRGLAGEGRVAPVVVHRRVVEPARDLGPARDLRGVREGGGGDGREPLAAVRVVGVVEGPAVLGQVGEGALGEVAGGLLPVVHDVGGVVGDDVEEDLHALGVGLGDEVLEVLVGAEVRVDLGEVGDPVAVVAGGGVGPRALHRAVLEDRRHPDGGRAEPLDVVQPPGQALEVASLVETLVGGVVPGAEA